jgi:hypothetical protein
MSRHKENVNTNHGHRIPLTLLEQEKQIVFINQQIKAALKETQPIFQITTEPLDTSVVTTEDGQLESQIFHPVNLKLRSQMDLGIFAIFTLRDWWDKLYRPSDDPLNYVILTIKGEAEFGYDSQEFLLEIQKFANHVKLPVKVCYIPDIKSPPLPTNPLFSFTTPETSGFITKALMVAKADVLLVESPYKPNSFNFIMLRFKGEPIVPELLIHPAKSQPTWNFIVDCKSNYA